MAAWMFRDKPSPDLLAEPNENLRDGMFRTSDLAEITGGKVYLRGRDSDQINVARTKGPAEAIEKRWQRIRTCVSA